MHSRADGGQASVMHWSRDEAKPPLHAERHMEEGSASSALLALAVRVEQVPQLAARFASASEPSRPSRPCHSWLRPPAAAKGSAAAHCLWREP